MQLAITWKSAVKSLGLWKSVSAIARLYDAGMGILLFIPIVVLSWFPFVSTFQTRLLFNQAFSRGLEISLILAGNKPNAQLLYVILLLMIIYHHFIYKIVCIRFYDTNEILLCIIAIGHRGIFMVLGHVGDMDICLLDMRGCELLKTCLMY